MNAWLDRLTLLCLVATAGLLLGEVVGGTRLAARVWVPLLLPEDPPGSLHLPDADAVALRTRAASIGEVVTIEDLVRVVLALETGEAEAAGLGDLPALSAEERAALRELVEQADRHRQALLAAEGDLARSEAELNDAAGRLAALLTPEQRRWVQEHRDAVSVAEVEAEYWARAREALQ